MDQHSNTDTTPTAEWAQRVLTDLYVLDDEAPDFAEVMVVPDYDRFENRGPCLHIEADVTVVDGTREILAARIYTRDMGAVFAEIAAGNDGDLLHTAERTDPRYI